MTETVKILRGQINKIEKLAELPFYTEGPAMDRGQNLYFTTLSGGVIYKMDKLGRLSVWAETTCPNGQYILENDEHLVCDSVTACIYRFDASGNCIGSVIEGNCAGEKVYCPNDLVADNSGNIYFTDSIRENGKVFFIGRDGSQEVLATSLDYPNGLILSRDGRFLWVAESYRNRIIQISLKNRKIISFAALPVHPSGNIESNLPDGMAMDPTGNLWVAHYGMGSVLRISYNGATVEVYDTEMPLTSNLIFINHTTAIVTGGYSEPGPGALFKIHFRS